MGRACIHHCETGSGSAVRIDWKKAKPTQVAMFFNCRTTLIEKVEANAHVDAIESFYAPHASMQENELPPRASRDVLVAHESNFLSRLRSLTSKCVRPVFVNGDCVVIRWIFEFEALDGTRTRLEELAYQRWEDDRIVEEKFFYDPRQLGPSA